MQIKQWLSNIQQFGGNAPPMLNCDAAKYLIQKQLVFQESFSNTKKFTTNKVYFKCSHSCNVGNVEASHTQHALVNNLLHRDGDEYLKSSPLCLHSLVSILL